MPRDIEQLLGQPENDWLEYKAVVTPPERTAAIIAGFANAAGGVLIFGVRDDLSVEGIAEDVPAASVVESALKRLDPRPIVKHYFIRINQNSKDINLYVIEVEKSFATVVAQGQYIFTRVGPIIVKRTVQERAQILRPIKPKSPELTQLLDQIKNSRLQATESKLKFLEHYQQLFLIASASMDILSPEAPMLPSGIPQGRVLIRLLFSSLVNTFEIYLADLLLEIYLAQPNILKSYSTVTVEDVLNQQDIAGFIQYIATKKVQKLKIGGGEEDFRKSFKSSIGLDLFIENEANEISDLFQVRHLYTHNNGIIDDAFLTKHRGSGFQLGEEHKLSVSNLCKSASTFIKIVDRLDNEAVQKFQLSVSKPDNL